MTSSSLKPLSSTEKAAWAAQNAFEDAERLARYRPLPFIEKLRAIEGSGRLAARFKELAAARSATQPSR